MSPTPSDPTLRPGLLVLHGNRLETLADTVFAWLAEHPLAPLEEEAFLVQSNGMAEWLKMGLATAHGVCAATRIELPARFIWRAMRAVLGRSAVPAFSPVDKLPLTWRLMHLLPSLIADPVFAPVAAFLQGGDPARRLQLAQRLADLFDQYQLYRSAWLDDWAEGRDRLRTATGHAPVPDDQRWQPALWRAVLASLPEEERFAIRPALHARFVEALRADGTLPRLPRRVVLFGTTHIPHQTLEILGALSAHSQVLMAVPNPCRFHWADTIAGRELLGAARHRLPSRHGRDLAAVPLQEMHAHGHPLLAAWGRQARDFVRQLDAFDDVQQSRERFALPRVDLFDEGPGQTLLQQVQASMRELLPLAEHPHAAVPSDDRSIVFHVAHSAQREVEVLHDQLLHLFAHPPGGRPLNPRDVVVMVPDVDAFAPAIRSVFGQYGRGHARHIPWGITDQHDRGRHPLLVALEWLLRAPRQRFTGSELRDLLDLPAVARRFHVPAEDLPAVAAWIEGAGIRWGLDESQRETLGLQACGDVNTWHFGLRRMLLGYATGELPAGHDGIEPYAEVAGLAAGLAGALAEFVDTLAAWWRDAVAPRPPEAWGTRLRELLQAMFEPADDLDRALVAALDDALVAWLTACQSAGFDEAIELDVVREAWLAQVDEPGVSRRFRAGGVTFCTLLPMRAIPFEVLCLLGMNDGDYPRRSPRSDFDLMALPGQSRPGDRSRRDDDRQLMLDALLSARRVLYLSWAGRSLRDNQEQPPSVLVSQLRDYLAAGWHPQVVEARTTEHPMQPFSRRYFEAGSNDELLTYAGEWRSAHAPVEALAPTALTTRADPSTALDVRRLADFLRNPVKAFFRHRLQVSFDDIEAPAEDDEAFATAGLDRWQLMDEVIAGAKRSLESSAPGQALPALVAAQVDRLQRAGRLPLAGPGQRVREELVGGLLPMVRRWQAELAAHPQPRDKLALRFEPEGGPSFDDWLVGLRAAGPGDTPAWIELQASKLANKKVDAVRPDKLLPAFVRCLAAAAGGQAVAGILIGPDAVLRVDSPPADEARDTLRTLMQACREGLAGEAPMATAVLTGLQWLEDAAKAPAVYDGSEFVGRGEAREPCLSRLFPDFEALSGRPDFEPATQTLYEPFAHWLAHHVSLSKLETPGDD